MWFKTFDLDRQALRRAPFILYGLTGEDVVSAFYLDHADIALCYEKPDILKRLRNHNFAASIQQGVHLYMGIAR
jgi:hypothetical protein